ncbi:unnamed protein product, partial [Darwinula stevensoni]
PRIAPRDRVQMFESYEEYLDSQVTPLDVFLLQDRELARKMVELGYRGTGDIMTRRDFLAQLEPRERRSRAEGVGRREAEAGESGSLSGEIARREEANLAGKINLLTWGGTGQVRRTIGEAHDRLNADGGLGPGKTVVPRWSDLSYLCWDTGEMKVNASGNFAFAWRPPEARLRLRNRHDGALLSLDPREKEGERVERHEMPAGGVPGYEQVVFFDYHVRPQVKKTTIT